MTITMGESMSSAAPPRSRTATRKEYDYRSSPLSEHERTFRLIQLLKHADGSLLYDLVPFQLANAPNYEAISYRWGSAELSHSITIGNASLRVTSSVYDILNDDCLQPQEPRETRYLWIDFVCINQKDKTEKDNQIPLMRDIYVGASKVVIYLGDAPDAERAHECLARFKNYMEFRFRWSQSLPVLETLFPSLNPLRDRATRDAFLHMVIHDYWSRTWVIQEIACGKQVSILYGGHYVDWKLFSDAAILLKAKNGMLNMLLEGVDEARSTVILSALDCISSIWILQKPLANGTPLPLANILLYTGYSKASLPQDKVVALLGLSMDADHPDLQPNHELAVEQVYQKVTTHSLRQGSFALLNIAGLANRELYGSTISGLPSWVPDFSSPSLGHPSWPYRSGGMWAEGNVVTYNELDALMPNRLSVKGIVIGRIAVMSTLHVQPSHWKDASLHDTRSTVDWLSPTAVEESIHYISEQLQPESDFHHEIWEMVEAHCPEPYLLPNGVSISRHEALWRTVVENVDMQHGITSPASEELGRKYGVFQSVCRALRAGNFVSRLMELQDNQEDWNSFHQVVHHLIKSTCAFVVTDEGHMGAVVVGAKVGDVVCVLRGANVPYILRPNKDDDQGTMQLVCASYIHGFMDGEAIECGKYEDTWFQIV